jgi:hypothetical protein
MCFSLNLRRSLDRRRLVVVHYTAHAGVRTNPATDAMVVVVHLVTTLVWVDPTRRRAKREARHPGLAVGNSGQGFSSLVAARDHRARGTRVARGAAGHATVRFETLHFASAASAVALAAQHAAEAFRLMRSPLHGPALAKLKENGQDRNAPVPA